MVARNEQELDNLQDKFSQQQQELEEHEQGILNTRYGNMEPSGRESDEIQTTVHLHYNA